MHASVSCLVLPEIRSNVRRLFVTVGLTPCVALCSGVMRENLDIAGRRNVGMMWKVYLRVRVDS